MADLRSIEEQYWRLSQQYVGLQAIEAAVALATEVLGRRIELGETLCLAGAWADVVIRLAGSGGPFAGSARALKRTSRRTANAARMRTSPHRRVRRVHPQSASRRATASTRHIEPRRPGDHPRTSPHRPVRRVHPQFRAGPECSSRPVPAGQVDRSLASERQGSNPSAGFIRNSRSLRGATSAGKPSRVESPRECEHRRGNVSAGFIRSFRPRDGRRATNAAPGRVAVRMRTSAWKRERRVHPQFLDGGQRRHHYPALGLLG